MQFQTLKAVKSSDSQFHIMIASINKNSDGKYEGILMVADKEKYKSEIVQKRQKMIGYCNSIKRSGNALKCLVVGAVKAKMDFKTEYRHCRKK